ncbi:MULTISPECIES: hypothetical protein [Microcystis]|jgi:hypothetical protein|uniref:DUF2281 domain-containing protein n=6 Tax=Microcystis TaxID=1125 RepID=I4HW64_MICAE|nr:MULTISPECIES: hypothetical protein [Microcystis]MCE2672560.1 hypothetical protein [Microcystis sp. 53598_E5]MCU7241956.1 hypothetical protein [Microcystis aeruginosa WS75]MDJ0525307.1 hypothetical protein [Microcystis sp. M53600_WE12]MDJ0561148.1 hypothetical protein [Microcystis sp. M53599_WE4]NCR02008.1 hypothetical protein [Microcystis aeruginosa L211-11]NCR17289.1 hypothetical protein [Microcystis aeruginosa LL13-03]NCR33578.1 hypothetical protein [Microcystis aeruginosa L211-101]NCS
MNDVELRQLLTEKLAILSADNLNLVGQFIDKLTHQEAANKSDNYLTEKALQKWQFLVKNNQEMDNTNPLSENEIKIIWQFLSQSHRSRPVGLARGEFTISDDFNEPLPEEVLDLFYPQ